MVGGYLREILYVIFIFFYPYYSMLTQSNGYNSIQPSMVTFQLVVLTVWDITSAWVNAISYHKTKTQDIGKGVVFITGFLFSLNYQNYQNTHNM